MNRFTVIGKLPGNEYTSLTDGSMKKEHQQLIAKVRRLKHSGVTFEVRLGGILTARLPTGLWCIILDNYPDEVCNELIDITL